MDFLDIFAVLPPNVPGATSRERSLQENIAGAVGLMIFPVLDFVIVLLARLYETPIVAGAVLPGAFASMSLILCGFLRVSRGWTIVVALGCLFLCLTASMAAMLLGVFVSIYSAF
jgi:hypothetical protein